MAHLRRGPFSFMPCSRCCARPRPSAWSGLDASSALLWRRLVPSILRAFSQDSASSGELHCDSQSSQINRSLVMAEKIRAGEVEFVRLSEFTAWVSVANQIGCGGRTTRSPPHRPPQLQLAVAQAVNGISGSHTPQNVWPASRARARLRRWATAARWSAAGERGSPARTRTRSRSVSTR